ncbi:MULTISPECIES: H-NS histone family protein [Cupriavidus]|uniref:H-NS histone family protein n=1 Tax=Cupriavidus pauculus TaxID=82633 RepID=A0A3G8H713_9BURK|nr:MULTISPECIES: H-NS histone family protein [Cupriavidus]AZG16216.1 H-NS histone family protein [Cupriavidus pauculus]MDT6963286.1 H-NS histone family protein [Cupriavidus sp. SZY C1]
MATYQEIVQKISELQKQAEEIKAREQASVIAEIREKIEQFGLTAEDLGFGGKAAAGKKAPVARKVPVRYRDSAGNTWTGRGKRPGWLTQALANGKSMEDFLIR